MFNSRVNTIQVPIIGATPPAPGPVPSASPIIGVAPDNCTVRVRNNSFGIYVWISFEAGPISTFPMRADAYKLPAGGVETFTVAQGQGLYVSATSGGVDNSKPEISYHIFDRIPVEDA